MNVFAEYGDEEENRQIRESLAAQEQREEQERFEQFLKDNGLVTFKYFCSKDESHSLTYILFIEDGYIRKIGQYPSYADIDIPQDYMKVICINEFAATLVNPQFFKNGLTVRTVTVATGVCMEI